MQEELLKVEDKLMPEERAYLAGFFDGEGSVSAFCHAKGTWIMRMTVSNTYPEPVRRFQDAFGGSIRYVERPTRAWKNCYLWQLYGNKCIWALKAMLPYLTVKRERAQVAMEFQQLRKVGLGRREQLGQQLCELNRKGK